MDAGRESGADGGSGSFGRAGFGGCPAARDFEEPVVQLAFGVAGSSRCRCGTGNLCGVGRFIQLGVLTEATETDQLALPAASAACPRGTGLSLAERVGVIEIDLPDGVRVRVDDHVSEKALRRVLAAMKAR